jgi:hypothetical protein
MSSISISVSDNSARRGEKMRLVVSILPPPGWLLIAQNGNELVYQRIAAGDESDSASFEIRAITKTENT